MQILQNYFSETGPGAAIAICRDGYLNAIECFGMADVENHILITPETIFDIASVSKTFTAVMVMRMVERGDLVLTTPIDAIFPEFGCPKIGRRITLMDLLQHTSGLQDYLELGVYTPLEKASKIHVLSQLPKWISGAQPGKQYEYCNTNYFVLALVVECVTGNAFVRSLESQLFAPAGFSATSLGPPADLVVAKGYAGIGYGIPKFESAENVLLDTYGDGGIFSCLSDLIRWQEALWNGGIIRFESLQQMCIPGTLDTGEFLDYGIGMQIETSSSERWLGHGGAWCASTTMLGRYIQANAHVIVLSNEFAAPVERISQSLASLTVGHLE